MIDIKGELPFWCVINMIKDFFQRQNIPIIGMLLLLTSCWQVQTLYATEIGKESYTTHCGVCHTMGGGRLVGPDLDNVFDRRSQAWLEMFIKSPLTVINSGDEYAVALYEEFDKIPMPDSVLSGEQIKQVLVYIQEAGSDPSSASNQPKIQEASENIDELVIAENILKGRDLFQGIVRFKNNGPTCITCHDVTNDAVIGGGVLAAELTSVFSKMGSRGVRAILGKAPYPVMEIAYRDKALTEDEILSLVAFLQNTDEQHAFQHPRDYGKGLFLSGIMGALILYGFYSLLWLRRRRESVNQRIYDRQDKSI